MLIEKFLMSGHRLKAWCGLGRYSRSILRLVQHTHLRKRKEENTGLEKIGCTGIGKAQAAAALFLESAKKW